MDKIFDDVQRLHELALQLQHEELTEKIADLREEFCKLKLMLELELLETQEREMYCGARRGF